MSSVNWDPIVEEISQPLDYGRTPRKVHFSTCEEGAIEATGLSNWMTLDTPTSNGGEEGAEGSLLDKSAEDEHQVFEKMTKLIANSEALKEALEQEQRPHTFNSFNCVNSCFAGQEGGVRSSFKTSRFYANKAKSRRNELMEEVEADRTA
jgi:hypothetical protein